MSPERAAALISGAVEHGTYFTCHVASIEDKDIVCRRFFDEYKDVSQILLIAQRLGVVEFVPQPDKNKLPTHKMMKKHGHER